MLDELDGAKANRSALAAVAVLPSPELGALKGRRARVFDDARFVCVLDKESWDALPLELTYVWAKMAALKISSPDTVFEGVAMQVVSLVEKGLRQLDKIDSVRAQFKKATEGITSAEGVVIDTKAEVCATLHQAISLLRAHEN